MKRLCLVSTTIITVLLLVQFIGIPVWATGDDTVGFEDVFSADYYYDSVQWAVDNNITGGLTATSFSPAVTCTRGQVVTFLWRANGEPEPSNLDSSFLDVKEDNYFYKAVLWAVEKGITGGISTDYFGPYKKCTRAQTITFLWRAEGSPSAFSESNWSSQYAGTYYCEALKWAESCGIAWNPIKGFNPNDYCPRADIVTYMYNAMEVDSAQSDKESDFWSDHIDRYFYLNIVSAYQTSYGTDDAALEISSAEEFASLSVFSNSSLSRNFAGKYISLAQDIDIGNYQWQPICSPSTKKEGNKEFYANGGFKGTFEGNSHYIKNLNFNAGNRCIVGLFGAIDCGTVQNINVSGKISGYWNLGSIAGYNMYGTILNCNSDMTIGGNGLCIGGIAGQNVGDIIGCTFSGTVKGHPTQSGNVGGISGWCGTGFINNCFCSGNVSGGFRIGGLSGRLQNSGIIQNSVFSGVVNGNQKVGTFVGLNDGSNSAIINCTTN